MKSDWSPVLLGGPLPSPHPSPARASASEPLGNIMNYDAVKAPNAMRRRREDAHNAGCVTAAACHGVRYHSKEKLTGVLPYFLEHGPHPVHSLQEHISEKKKKVFFRILCTGHIVRPCTRRIKIKESLAHYSCTA